MRENPPFEVRLDRFGIRRAAVAIVAFLAIAALSGAWSTAAARAGENAAWVLAVAALLAAATPAAARSLIGVARAELARRDASWSSALRSGATTAGVAVALDSGAFFLSRIECERDRVGLPLQRGGLERDRLRCAHHSSSRLAVASAQTAPPAE
jgi:hypothetical protein